MSYIPIAFSAKRAASITLAFFVCGNSVTDFSSAAMKNRNTGVDRAVAMYICAGGHSRQHETDIGGIDPLRRNNGSYTNQ